jgi:hypothetical protein
MSVGECGSRTTDKYERGQMMANAFEEFAECGQGWLDGPCKHESSIQDCIQCLCKHGHARDCGEVNVWVPLSEKIYYGGKVYDARIDELMGDLYLGGRLTDCCECFSSIDDGPLYCKKCYEEVEMGEGDGSENLTHGRTVKWHFDSANKQVVACEIEE